jgi:hypothetical protein
MRKTSSLEVSIMHEVVPQAAVVWMILLLAVALAVALMAVPRKLRTGGSPADPPPARPGHLRYDAEVAAADRAAANRAAANRAAANRAAANRAAEVAAAADRAAVLADRRRAEWQEALAAVDSAWCAYREADAEARRFAAATAYPVMRRRRARTENADRERYLHRAATAACRRREISIGQLNEALAHRGWNPRLHPAAQEAALHCATREHRLAGYSAATERERRAWAAAEEAADRLRTLRAEACAAALRASVAPSADVDGWAGQRTTAEPVCLTAPEPVRTTLPEPVRAALPEPVRTAPA